MNRPQIIDLSKPKAILERRMLCDKEPQQLRKKRMKFLSWLRVHNFNSEDLKSNEMYRFVKHGTTKTKLSYPQFETQILFHNTRLKLPTEVDFEIDDLPHKQALAVISEICLSLINQNYHFAVFYSEGARSPHIRIYDFDVLQELDAFHRQEAEKEFWKSVSPMLWKYCDKSIWQSGHTLQLEFALHWKHRTPFNLLFEFIPTKKDIQGDRNASLTEFSN